jgi:hypothetical protein
LRGGQPLKADDQTLASLPAALKTRARLDNGAIYIAAPLIQASSTAPGTGTVTVTATSTTTGPQIGDVRVTFATVGPQDVTVQAAQIGETLRAFTGKTGTINPRMKSGLMTIEQFSEAVKGDIATRTWILRFIGFLMMSIGVGLVLSPLAVLGDVIPFVGGILQTGVFLVAVMVAVPLALLTIAVSWVFARPLVGIPLLVLAVGGVVAIFVMNANKKKAVAG